MFPKGTTSELIFFLSQKLNARLPDTGKTSGKLMSLSNSVSRRRFLAQGAALTAATSLPKFSFAHPGGHGPAPESTSETMRTKAIPGTDEHLPIIGLGAPDMFYKMPPEGAELPKSLIKAMVDMGGTLIDTPAFFRPDVPVIGDFISEMGLQEDLFLAGKITVTGKQEGIDHLEKTITNLDKRPLDLMLIQNFRDMPNNWPTLKDAKAEGKVRYIGISRTNDADKGTIEQFMKDERPDFIMPGYNMFQNEPEERILPLAADLGIGVIVVEPFRVIDDGAYFSVVAGKELPRWAADFDCESWAQFGLKYIASHPAVTSIATETSSVKHVMDNMRAGYGKLPDEAMRKRMSEHFLTLV
jgi:diketogulonate reductase-like aldo/keto reductase